MNRLPPASVEAEQSVLGSMIIDNDCMNSVFEIVKSEHFYTPTYAYIFTCIKELAQARKPVDMITLNDYIEAKNLEQIDFAHIGELARNTPSSANVIEYCNMLVKNWNGRKIIEACHKALDNCYTSDGYEKYREILYKDLEGLFLGNGEEEISDGEDLCNTFIDELERLTKTNGDITGFSTGDKHIDEATGGLNGGDYVTIAARPGAGKTTRAMNILGHFIKENRRCLFFSMEMKKQKVMMKLCSDLANVPFAAIKSADLHDEYWNRVTNTVARIKKSKIHVDDSSGLSIDDVIRKARQIKAKYGELDLIVLDFVQRLKIDTNNMYQELTSASHRLKDLFMELDCPGIVLAQLKKNSIGMPNASDLKETGAIESDSDCIIFLHTPSEDLKPHKGMLTMEIFNKVRFGETGVKMLKNELDYQRFACTDEEYQEQEEGKPFKRKSYAN